MASRSDDFRKQVNELWQQALDQLEDVKDALGGRLEADIIKLRQERDRLLKVLGEQTYRLANQGKMPVPDFVKRTVDRLNDVIEGLVKKQGGAKKRKKATKRKASKKKAAKKKTTKKKTPGRKTTAKKTAR